MEHLLISERMQSGTRDAFHHDLRSDVSERKGLFTSSSRGSYCLPLSRDVYDPRTDAKTDQELECTNRGLRSPSGAPKIFRNFERALMTVQRPELNSSGRTQEVQVSTQDAVLAVNLSERRRPTTTFVARLPFHIMQNNG
jgi:hypothetical protein